METTAVRPELVPQTNEGGAKHPETPEHPFARRLPVKRRRKKIMILLAACVFAAAGFFYFRTGSAPQPTGTAVRTEALAVQSVEESITVSGIVEGVDSARVMSASNAEITAVLVAVGDPVSKGQTLARLNVENLQSQYRLALSALETAERQYETTQELYGQGVIPQQEFLQAESKRDDARIALSAFDLGKESAITSPIAGTVTRVNASVGGGAAGSLAAGEPLFVIEDLSDMQIQVRVKESDIARISPGLTAVITSEMSPGTEAYGLVDRIAPTGEQKEAGSSQRVVPVHIKVTEANGLIAGVTGKTKIQIAKSENVLCAPADAIFTDPVTGENALFILEGSVLRQVPVTKGVEDILTVEISSDALKAGDRVVLSPSFEWTDGMEAFDPEWAPAETEPAGEAQAEQ
ncbi:MAG: efflux RND transporter periplasmic adaptor subunit [Clostridiales Family XIII bacterium]|nr:efflux RND transporter periplasmic adaptor subunit [Clostridiales Family XIII bacterium]